VLAGNPLRIYESERTRMHGNIERGAKDLTGRLSDVYRNRNRLLGLCNGDGNAEHYTEHIRKRKLECQLPIIENRNVQL
jgi:hypothetical protein